MARRTDACSTALRRAAVLALAALPGASGLGATAPAPAASEPATQQVQVTAPLPGARDEKTLSQLFAAQEAFERHHALAPDATLGFRLYARLDPQELARLQLWLVDGRERTPVPLDSHRRFALSPDWSRVFADHGARLRTNLPDGAVAWHVDVRSPGVPGDRRRLGDLRLECEADTFHGDLQRGLRTPVSAILDASDELCLADDAQAWFAERPIFGVALVAGERRRTLPYRYLHGSNGTMAMAALFDWPYALRDRTYFLPLDDRSWPDDTLVEFDAMDDPQPGPSP